LDTHARCSLPGGRPSVELARFLSAIPIAEVRSQI
jgi:hypothetical protein